MVVPLLFVLGAVATRLPGSGQTAWEGGAGSVLRPTALPARHWYVHGSCPPRSTAIAIAIAFVLPEAKFEALVLGVPRVLEYCTRSTLSLLRVGNSSLPTHLRLNSLAYRLPLIIPTKVVDL